MELMAAAAARFGADNETINKILDCVVTEEAIAVMEEKGLKEKSFEYITDKISFYLNKRSTDKMKTECIVYSNAYGLLGQTEGAASFIEEAKGKSTE